MWCTPFICLYKWHFWEVLCPHTEQTKAFSPVWTRMCLCRCQEPWKDLPQRRQSRQLPGKDNNENHRVTIFNTRHKSVWNPSLEIWPVYQAGGDHSALFMTPLSTVFWSYGQKNNNEVFSSALLHISRTEATVIQSGIKYSLSKTLLLIHLNWLFLHFNL